MFKTNPPKEQQVHSLKGIASLYFNMKKFDQSREYYQKVAELDPNDPETYYSIAVIDWSQTYAPRMEARAKLGLKPTDEPKDKKVCADLLKTIKDKKSPLVQDGIQKLQKSIEMRPDYDDAMAYLNLMYREEADLDCDNPDARKDLKTADDWVDKNLATKKAKAEKAGPSGWSPPSSNNGSGKKPTHSNSAPPTERGVCLWRTRPFVMLDSRYSDNQVFRHGNQQSR